MIVHTISFQKSSVCVKTKILIAFEIILNAFLDAGFLLSGVKAVFGVDTGLEAEVADLVDGDS
jgi:hypothetical protein